MRDAVTPGRVARYDSDGWRRRTVPRDPAPGRRYRSLRRGLRRVSSKGVRVPAADEPQSNGRRGPSGRNVAPAGAVRAQSSTRYAHGTVALHGRAESVLELSPQVAR